MGVKGSFGQFPQQMPLAKEPELNITTEPSERPLPEPKINWVSQQEEDFQMPP